MSSDKNCCVPGCKDSGGMHRVLHGFPNPERDRDRFNEWIYAIGGDILGLENERIFKYRRVCRSHFQDKYLCRNNKISNIAVPTLNMPVYTMPRYVCCVPGCSVVASDGVPLHYFPNPETFAEKFKTWVDNIGGDIASLDYTTIRETRKICRRHFEKQYLYPKNRLSKLAVPTLLLNSGDVSAPTTSPVVPECQPSISKGALSLNPLMKHSKILEKPVKYKLCFAEIKCCVRNCANRHNGKGIINSSDHRITFHSFPKDPKQRAAWIKSLGMSNCMPSKRTMICSEHFKDTDLIDTYHGTRRIKNGAVPVVDKDRCVPIATRVCKMCLSLDRKMYHIKKYYLDVMYQNVLGITPRTDDWLPQSICWECAARLTAAESFKENALLADAVLTEESSNLADVLKIHRKYQSLKSSLGVHKVFSIQLQEDQEVENETIDVPHNDEIDIEMNELVKDTVRYIDEENNEFIEEYLDLDEDAVKTEVDLVPPIEVDTVPADVDVTQDSDDLDYEDVHYLENEDTDIESLNESIDEEDEINNINVLDTNEKNLKNNKENKQNDGVNISNVVAKRFDNPVVSLDKIIPTIEVRKKPVKRPAVNTDNEDVLNTKRKSFGTPSVPIDEKVFTITPLKHEDFIQEVLKRKDSDRYKRALYRCHDCYLGFRSKDVLARHAVKHTDKCGPIVCPICKFHMRTQSILRSHMKHKHSNEYVCKLCPMVTRVKSVAKGHVQFHAGKTYQCPHCPQTFKKHTSFASHKRLKHLSDCVCELCGHTFIGQNGVRAHKALQHKFVDENVPLEGPYCDVCDVTFLSQQAYDKHMRLSSKHITSEDDPNRISNDSTVKGCRTSWGKEYYQLRRVDDDANANSEPVTCEQCGLELLNFRDYGKHFKSAHPGMNRTQNYSSKYMCEHCGKMFTSKTFLEGHLWVHTGQKCFECDHCHKKFTMKASLMTHIQNKHDNTPKPPPRAYPCPICGKNFSLSQNLKRHVFLHTGLRPFKCDSCEKDFPTLEQLRLHVNHVHLKKPRPKRVRRREKAKKCGVSRNVIRTGYKITN